MKKYCCFLLVFLIVFVGACSTGNSPKNPVDWQMNGIEIIKANDWEQIYINDFYLLNSTWGKGDITKYKQVLFKAKKTEAFPFGWKWDWPNLNIDQVKAYPSISYGDTPWAASPSVSTTPLLPLRMDAIKEIKVFFDVCENVKGSYNLSFDLWITSQAANSNPPAKIITKEIMIWLDYKSYEYPQFWFVKMVTIDGENYDFFEVPQTKEGDYFRDMLVFIKKKPKLIGDIRIDKFLAYLLESKKILPTDYFKNIDLGNEIWYGTGETTVNDFRVSIVKK
jgi:hypothetical protein